VTNTLSKALQALADFEEQVIGKPFVVWCGQCHAEWKIGEMPLTIRELHHKTLAGCPSCGARATSIYCHPRQAANRLPI
jgi:hypothetical protein